MTEALIRSASSAGTPLAVRMLSVRVNRAVLSPRVTRPKIGARSSQQCTRRRMCSCFSSRVTMMMTAPTMPAISKNHQFWTKFEIAISTRVITGSSCPVVSNTPTTFGTTAISITMMMISAIVVSRIG